MRSFAGRSRNRKRVPFDFHYCSIKEDKTGQVSILASRQEPNKAQQVLSFTSRLALSASTDTKPSHLLRLTMILSVSGQDAQA
jgi:hypothetical protein